MKTVRIRDPFLQTMIKEGYIVYATGDFGFVLASSHNVQSDKGDFIVEAYPLSLVTTEQ